MWTNMFHAFVNAVKNPYITANFTHKVENGASIYDHFAYKLKAHKSELDSASDVLLAALPFVETTDKFVSRDVMDICRTMLGRFMNFVLMKIILLADTDNARTRELREKFDKLLELMGELLAHHEDYSLYASLGKLSEEAPVTENFEETLKRNCSARYCRSYVAEPARFLYPKEAKAVLDWICTEKTARATVDFAKIQAELAENFMSTPLEKMQTPPKFAMNEILTLAAEIMKSIDL
jgi:hypothetical protein